MQQQSSLWSLLTWLVTENDEAPELLAPTDVLLLAMAVLSVIALVLIQLARRNSAKREAKAAQIARRERIAFGHRHL